MIPAMPTESVLNWVAARYGALYRIAGSGDSRFRGNDEGYRGMTVKESEISGEKG